jgi:hypothetical protein
MRDAAEAEQMEVQDIEVIETGIQFEDVPRDAPEEPEIQVIEIFEIIDRGPAESRR